MSYSFKKSLLTTTVFVGVAGLATPAFAQNAQGQIPVEDVQTAPVEAIQPDAIDPGQEIVVTGTLIRNPNLEQSSPVTVIGSEEIELQQANVAEEFLRELPGAVPSVGSQVNNGNGGASFVNLRGLGVNRNLVLLDGTRVVPAGLGGVVDLNNIPLALLERVDVLTGGASTTYGADAVTGVVNFITRDDFAGAEIALSNGITERGDGNIFRADLTVGANFDDGRGNAVLSIGYQEADEVFQGDREIGQDTISSSTGGAGGSATAVPSVFAVPGLGLRQIRPDGSLVPLFAPFNFSPQNIFQTPFERFNIFSSANYEVADGVQVYGQALFSKNTVGTRIASSGTFGNVLQFGLGNPFLPATTRAVFCAQRPASQGGPIDPADCAAAALTTDPDDPAFREVGITTLRRFVEAGTRNSDFGTQLFQLKAGVRGDITQNIGFDLYGTYGESENIQRQSGQGLRSRLFQAVDAVRAADGSIVCRDTSNACAPIDLFGPQGSISPESLAFLNVTTTASTITSLATVRGVISGDLGFTSPLADEAIGIAIGGEFRRYTGASASDVANQTPGEVLGNGAASPDIFGEYDVKEAFAELIAPLITDRAFFRSLTLELGGRVSDYSTSGTSYTYKAGGSWEPIDSLKIRGAYSRATRSPNIGELFNPVVTGLDNLEFDPCQEGNPVDNAALTAICLAQGANADQIGTIGEPSAGQVNITFGGNPNLDVERADTYTIGAVFQPDFIPGLAITVDYYDITVKDAISAPSVGDALDACFGPEGADNSRPNLPAGAAQSDACTSIRRDPATGQLSGPADTTPGFPLASSNLGRLETSGIDVGVNYRRDLGFAGLNLSFNGNWTDKAIFQATPTSIRRDCVGFYSVNCASLQPEFSFTQRTTLSLEQVDLSLLWRYIHDMEVEPGAGTFLPEFSEIDAKHYFDLSAQFAATDNLTITMVVNNLFDKDPPLVGSSIGSTAFNSGNTFPSTYDPLGRRYQVGAKLRF